MVLGVDDQLDGFLQGFAARSCLVGINHSADFCEHQCGDAVAVHRTMAPLAADQQSLVRRLVETYCAAMPAEVATERLRLIESGPATAGAVHHGWDDVHFAWSGSLEPGIGHAYVVEGPSFVIEFVNVQPDAEGNPANHIHCVWRDKTGDFDPPAG